MTWRRSPLLRFGMSVAFALVLALGAATLLVLLTGWFQ
jgi:hypothetical protein